MPDQLEFFIDRTPTPVGDLAVVTDTEGRLRAVAWSDRDDDMRRLLGTHYGPNGYSLESRSDYRGRTSAIKAYFEGNLGAIDGLPVETAGTPFQRSVWRALRPIPTGQTISYGELARRIGNPAAVRAVGLANGANPIGVVVPCHRVIGADGSLTGFGGGLDRKRWLLEHEGARERATLELKLG